MGTNDFFFFFFFWLRLVTCGILIPQPGIKPVPTSFTSFLTIREVLSFFLVSSSSKSHFQPVWVALKCPCPLACYYNLILNSDGKERKWLQANISLWSVRHDWIPIHSIDTNMRHGRWFLTGQIVIIVLAIKWFPLHLYSTSFLNVF